MALTDENGQVVNWFCIFDIDRPHKPAYYLNSEIEINQFIVNYFQHNSIDSVDKASKIPLLSFLCHHEYGVQFINILDFATIDFIFSKNPKVEPLVDGCYTEDRKHEVVRMLRMSLIFSIIDFNINYRKLRARPDYDISTRFENDVYQQRDIYFLIKLLSYPPAQFLLNSYVKGDYLLINCGFKVSFRNMHELISTKAFHTDVYRKIGYIIINNQTLKTTNLARIVFDKLYP